jgi:hypothetical protein
MTVFDRHKKERKCNLLDTKEKKAAVQSLQMTEALGAGLRPPPAAKGLSVESCCIVSIDAYFIF